MKLLVLLACLAGPLGAQILPPGKAWSIVPSASARLDTIARAALDSNTERMECITTSMQKDSVFIILVTQPAKHIVHADSMRIDFDGPPCESWQPLIHTHIVDNGFREMVSSPDFVFAAHRGVFSFLMPVMRDGTWTRLLEYP